MPTQIRGDQIQSETITSDNILNDSITSEDIAAGTIVASDLALSLLGQFYKVKVNSGDSTADFLANKLTAGEGITLSTGSTITISSTGSGGGDSVTIGPLNNVPLAADFPTTVLGSGSVTNTASALIFKADAHGASFDVQQILQSAPGSPWARYFRIELNPVQKQYLYGGFCIKRSSTGEFVLWSLIHTGTMLELQYSEYSSTTSRSSFISSVPIESTAIYFKIEDDGTDFILSASPSGEAGTYVPAHSVGRTAYLASYDLIGFAADAFNSGFPNRDCIVAIKHYGTSPPTSGTGYAVSVNVQSGTSGTYVKPEGAVIAFIDLWGGSGGGGGGPRQDAANTASGGASGQAGEWLRWADNPVVIDGLSWSGGTGGSGGAGRTGSSGNGSAGGAGSDSTFAGRVAAGGNGGSGGQVTSASQGGGTAVAGGPGVSHTKLVYRSGLGGLVVGKACGSGVVGTGVAAGNTKSSGIDAAGGGGASGGTGGGLSSISAATGGDGGAQGATAGGAGGATEGAAGSAGTTPAFPHLPGSAGGGGASNMNGAGGAGGAPGRGCSGAGGGAGRNGNGGDGSAGSDGGCVIRTFCLTTTG